MSARVLAAVALAGAVALTGCVSCEDRADAKALENCEHEADPEARKTCRETVIATEEAMQQEQMQKLQQEIDASEERERLHKVYGDPAKSNP
jgi:NAD-dependent SIR2 family protein deacetylase